MSPRRRTSRSAARSDDYWSLWGRSDPYFAVTHSVDHRQGRNREEMFGTGNAQLEWLLGELERVGAAASLEGGALDFGCGVGRVLRPMAERFQHAVGIDVSQEMLVEARNNCDPGKTTLYQSNGDDLDTLLGDRRFTLVHSLQTLQHLRPARGLRVLEALLGRIATRGSAVLHIPMYEPGRLLKSVNRIRQAHPVLIRAFRLLPNAGASYRFSDPLFEWHVYSADLLLPLWQRAGLEVRHVYLTTGPYGRTSAFWFLTRPPATAPMPSTY